MPPPIPMAGPMAPGMGQPPTLPGLPPGALEALKGIQESPAPGKDNEALGQATMFLGQALQSVYLRSPKASKLIADAMAKVQQARQELENAGGAAGPPPNLMGGMPPGPPMGGPMGQPAML